MGNNKTRLRQEQINSLLKTTKFNEKEIHEWYAGFLKDYPSGCLSVEDLKNTYNSFQPHGDASKYAEHVFRTLDADRDGNIDFQEFLFVLSITSRGSIDEKLRWAFFYNFLLIIYQALIEFCIHKKVGIQYV
jgi:Ca2+-binding EF-hand superfamily protein